MFITVVDENNIKLKQNKSQIYKKKNQNKVLQNPIHGA